MLGSGSYQHVETLWNLLCFYITVSWTVFLGCTEFSDGKSDDMIQILEVDGCPEAGLMTEWPGVKQFDSMDVSSSASTYHL